VWLCQWQKMESVEMLLELLTNHHSDVPVPGCLTHCINLELLQCKICSEPFTNIHSLIRHGKKHAEEKKTTCSFCSQDFESCVALSLHQLVWENKQEKNDNPEGELHCPLKCSQNSLSLESLKNHLMIVHGCEKSEISVSKSRSGGITVTSDLGDHQDICPRCGAKINTAQAHSLESHIAINCNARSETVSRAVSRILNMAAQADLEPLAVLKMEIESVVAQFEEQEGADDKLLKLGQMMDRKYSSLPDNFSRDFLWRVPDTFSQDNRSEEFVQQFDVWSEYIERLAGPDDVQHIIAQYEDIMSRSSGDSLQWKASTERDLYSKADIPASQLLSRLEAELVSLAGMSACPRDMESAVSQFQREAEGLLD